MPKNKVQFSASIHKANNLLASLMLSAQMLQKELLGPLNPKQKKYVNVLISESEKIKNLLKKLGS